LQGDLAGCFHGVTAPFELGCFDFADVVSDVVLVSTELAGGLPTHHRADLLLGAIVFDLQNQVFVDPLVICLSNLGLFENKLDSVKNFLLNI